MEPHLFFNHFSELEDPRIERTKQHLLIDIIALVLLGVLSGCKGWSDIEWYGKKKEKWLKTFLSLPYGIPSDTTISRVFSTLNPKRFYEYLLNALKALKQINEQSNDVICLDGKTLKGSHQRGKGKKALHLLSAWSTEHGLSLGQLKVNDKSNEIKAAPELLEWLDLKGNLVTADAMNCQKKIAEQIIKQEGDYLLAIKSNHKRLHQAVKKSFGEALRLEYREMVYSFEETLDGIEHGRIEKRFYTVLPAMYLPLIACEWKGSKSFIQVSRERYIKATGEIQKETIYYISSLPMDAQRISNGIRKHWSIENQLHWHLDVSFGEDQCRIREETAAENFSSIRRIALSILQKNTSIKASIRRKQLEALCDNEYLFSLFQQTIDNSKV